ncbi:AraC family transcriptional regulator [Pseudomonas aeruginosa]|uniref:AraC family transcriptional regulator n=1 Tax=Pseudomonadaceae TaxID=135621 RepID=UPI001C94EEB2|nr:MULTISPECIES: AraC family transcriptional regulator [Pseudomonas aeruginosa group]MCV0060104.1 AraC family transcriptional regulator [Pseudomonas aeruginosa]MCV0270889.1 AraC family transcriptional regulator [Pseudomonas aeruginosa]MDI2561829.1 AraC family transcriptional regulator [Pseudomonas aeruginosa]MDI3609772.1 AraC family transcriptional regulator [Pseudomonas aeruginosa]MDI3668030.1 AraC family transcriptional regulator [Pseudomonas aeruginosa]
MTASTTEKGTISVHLVAEALLELRRRGLPDEPLLEQAGIAQAQLLRPYARISAQAYARLWRAIAAAMDDEFFGMDGRRMKSGSFAYMAHAALSEPDIGSALQSMLRFLGLLFDDLQPRLERQGSLAQIVFDEGGRPPCRAFACFTLWLMLHGLACWLAGRRIAILGVELRCSAPDYCGDYRVMFSDHLRFERPHNRLSFNADCLALPVRRSARELRRFLAGAPGNILVRYRDPQSLGARIKAYLRSLKPERWPDLNALSGHFYMAPSTLRRKLAQEGQSYQGLKDQVRSDLAIARLDDGASNFSELAFDLGFADTSAFYKAFKKWTGTTPGQYRALHHPD